MNFFRLYLFVSLFLSFSLTYGQQIELSGKIIDSKSKQGIPFANIALKEIYKGTASNSLGDFSFKVDSLPIILVITHLSYEPLEIEVKDNKPVVFRLTPGKLLLDELVIKAKGNNNYAYDLVNKAYYRISSQYKKNQYGKAFYRQISKNGEQYSELYEMFYDTRFNQNGVDDWAIQEGRYALKLSSADSFIYNKNFTLMVRLLTVIQPKTEDLIMPISEHVREQYDLSLSEVLFVNNRRVAQIKFTKKTHVKFPAMEGEVYIDLENYNVLKIIGKIVDDNLKFITLKGENGSWENYEVNCEIAFKPLDDKILSLDYMRLGQNFDYYFDGVFTNQVETRSFLTYYEYYTPPKRKKLGGRLTRFNRRDSEILDNIGYNQDFWDENIIVKRTPVETEVISSFEADRSFGSIYLNNKNQIVLEDYEMDKDPFVIKVKKQLKNYVLPRYGEKVYLHHNKPFYTAGENIWVKSYLVNMATNIPSQKNGSLYVELISPEGSLIFSRLCQLQKGTWHGQLALPDTLPSGEYTLQAYTDWMKKFDENLLFKKNIEIYDPVESNGIYKRIKMDSVNSLKFYPEGGALIESMPMQVGFSATDKFGKGMEIKGKLIGDDGRQVAQIKGNNKGVGSFFILPKANFQYSTMISSDEIVSAEFPEVINSGYSIMVNMLKPNAIDISVRGTMKLEGKKIYLFVISNGVLYDRRIGALSRGLYKAEIPKANLPIGVSQILLVDEFEEIHCRRQVFINQPEEVTVKHYLAKKGFRSRERIDMVLELNDENGKAVSNADISISVLDRDKVSRNNRGSSIRSYFNLEFVADNDIAGPEQLFLDYDRETLKQTDWIMLSQQSAIPLIGSFDKLDIQVQVDNKKDNQLDLTGVVLEKETGRPLANSEITIISYPDYIKGFIITKTDNDGRFIIEDLNALESTSVLVVPSESTGSSKEIEVLFDEKKSTYIPDIRAVAAEEISRRKLDYINDQKEHLTKAGLSTKASMSFVFKPSKMYGEADNSVLIDDNFEKASDVLEVLSGRFPGVNVTGKGKDQKIRVRGEQEPPMILRDGIIIYNPLRKDKDELNPDNSLRAIISAINTDDIYMIDVIKEVPKGSYFEGRANNGIIALYSKSGKNPELKPGENGVLGTFLTGYDIVEEFSSPDYSDKSKAIKGLDNRTTLYWNPVVKTNRRGRAKIGFYNSDVAKSLQICIEGMSEEGVPIFNIFNIGKNAGRGNVN